MSVHMSSCRVRLGMLLVLGVLASVAVVSAAGVGAQEPVRFDFCGPLGEQGLPPQWSFNRWAPVVGLGSSFQATARVVQAGGQPVLYIKSVNAGLMVGTQRRVDVQTLRHASWSWLAQALPRGASFRQRATNDQALQLLFGFEGGHVVGYIWDSSGTVGASGSGLSWREDVRVIVLQAGDSRLGQWVSERRDLYADYVRLFGEPPPALVGVAIQSNSQHTESSGAGYVSAIELSAS